MRVSLPAASWKHGFIGLCFLCAAVIVMVVVVDLFRANHPALANAALERGDLPTAKTHFKLAVDEARHSGDKERLAIDLSGLAETYVRMKRPDLAEPLLADSVRLFQEHERSLGEGRRPGLLHAKAKLRLGVAQMLHGKVDTGLATAEEAVDMEVMTLGRYGGIGEYLWLAKLHRERQRFEDAERLLKKEMDRIPLTNTDVNLLFANCLEEQAALHRDSNNLTGLEDTWEASAKAIRENQKRRVAELSKPPTLLSEESTKVLDRPADGAGK